MPTLLGSITRAATRRDDDPLNILTFPTHERYETGLCKTGHRFWALRGDGIKDWNQTYAPLPSNYILLNPEHGNAQIYPEVDLDLILAQSIGHFPIGQEFSRKFHLPLVRLEHTLPVPEWDRTTMSRFKKMRGHLNVFISEYSREKWGLGEQERVIHHGLDTDTFAPDPSEATRQPHLLSVVNDWKNRNWCCGYELWREATTGLPVKVVGATPGLSEPAKNVAELVSFYQGSQVFVNTSLISPVPTALLEAMSAGCAVVSTATCMIPEIIKHGVNGLISNDPAEIAGYCRKLLDDAEYCRKLGEAARRTIVERFSMATFVDKWNKLFHEAADIPFKG